MPAQPSPPVLVAVAPRPRRPAPRRAGPRRRREPLPRVLAFPVLVTVVGLSMIARGGDQPPPAAQSPPPETRVEAVVAQAPPAPPEPAPPPVLTPTGELVVQPGGSPVAGSGRLVRYRVEVEAGLPVPDGEFVQEVDRVLADPRGWTTEDDVSVQRTDGPADLVVVLATPGTTDELCRPLQTAGRFSCFADGRAVINAERWLHGAESWGTDLAGYREYVVNHEVGHGLGHGHAPCPRAGTPAPVMVQQTKGLGGCTAHGWPVRPT